MDSVDLLGQSPQRLFMEDKPIRALVTKSNSLVEARYQFSIWETRVFTRLVSLIQPEDEDFKRYRLRIRDLIDFFGVNDNNAYAKIKAVPENLLKKVVTIPYVENGEDRFLKTGLIAQASIPKKKEGYIELSFHPDLKPYLLQLKRTFLSYDIRNVLKISSVHSIRIYELLKQYEKIGYREFKLDQLKKILGVQDKYKLYGHFKSRVLHKAQEDLKHYTDIRFTFEEIKDGRRVSALVFAIDANLCLDDEEENQARHLQKRLKEELEQQLQLWGIVGKAQVVFFKKFSLEYLEERVRYVHNQLAIKASRDETIQNIGGYFNTIVHKKDLVDYIEQQKQEKRSKAVLAKQRSAYKKQLKAALQQLKRELEHKEQTAIQRIFEREPQLKVELMEQVRTNSPNFYADEQQSNSDYFNNNPLFRAAVCILVKRYYHEVFSPLQASYHPRIEQLERQLNRL